MIDHDDVADFEVISFVADGLVGGELAVVYVGVPGVAGDVVDFVPFIEVPKLDGDVFARGGVVFV